MKRERGDEGVDMDIDSGSGADTSKRQKCMDNSSSEECFRLAKAPLLAWTKPLDPHPTVALSTEMKRWVRVPVPNVPSDRSKLLSYDRGLYLYQVHPTEEAIVVARIWLRMQIALRDMMSEEGSISDTIATMEVSLPTAPGVYHDSLVSLEDEMEVEGQVFSFDENFELTVYPQLVVVNPMTGDAKLLPPNSLQAVKVVQNLKIAKLKTIVTVPEDGDDDDDASRMDYSYKVIVHLKPYTTMYDSMDSSGDWQIMSPACGRRVKSESARIYLQVHTVYGSNEIVRLSNCLGGSSHVDSILKARHFAVRDYIEAKHVPAVTHSSRKIAFRLMSSPGEFCMWKQLTELAEAWIAQPCVNSNQQYDCDVAYCKVTKRLVIVMRKRGADVIGRPAQAASASNTSKSYPMVLGTGQPTLPGLCRFHGAHHNRCNPWCTLLTVGFYNTRGCDQVRRRDDPSAGEPTSNSLNLCCQGHHLCALDGGDESHGRPVRVVVYDFSANHWEEWDPSPVALPAWSESQLLELRFDSLAV